MSDLVDKYKAWDAVAEKNAEISRLRQALQDIAGSEPIPTPLAAWKFCKDVATEALGSEARQ